jgi:uncharacterized protein (TIGR02246 family)
MKNKMFATVGLMAVIVASGASAQSQLSSADTANAHSVDRAAGADRAIRAGVARWIQLIRAQDADGIARIYAADGVLMAPNVPIVSGHDELRKFWGAMVQIPDLSLTFEPQHIDVSLSGDLATDRGTNRLTGTPNGQQLDDSGKFIEVWRKIDGEWKVAANIFNSDKPAGK